MQENPPSRRRRGLALALVVLASLAAFAAVLAIWVNRQVLDTDNWTEASTELLAKPVVRDRVAGYLTDELYANVDVEARLVEALPDRADALAGPVAGALRDAVESRAREALAREDVQQLWEDANRKAHEALLRMLDGGGEFVSTDDGVVVLDLEALLQQTQERAGFGGRAAAALPPDAAQVEILRSDQLDGAQRLLKAVRPLPVILVVLSFGLFGAALLVAPGRRRRTLRGYGAGLVVAGGGALAAESLAGDALVGGLAQTAAGEPVVRTVYDIYTPLLEQAATATIGYGLVMILGAWLAGPSRPAVAIRRALAPYMREPALVHGVFAVVIAIVLFWWAPTPATRNPATAAVLVVLLVLGFEALRRLTVREFPDAERGAWPGAVISRAGRFTPADARLDQLERLERLRAAGVLDEAELRAEKQRVLHEENGAAQPAPAAPAPEPR